MSLDFAHSAVSRPHHISSDDILASCKEWHLWLRPNTFSMLFSTSSLCCLVSFCSWWKQNPKNKYKQTNRIPGHIFGVKQPSLPGCAHGQRLWLGAGSNTWTQRLDPANPQCGPLEHHKFYLSVTWAIYPVNFVSQEIMKPDLERRSEFWWRTAWWVWVAPSSSGHPAFLPQPV